MFCLKPLTQNIPRLVNQEDVKQTSNGCIFAAAGLASLWLPPPNWAVALMPGLISGTSVFFFLCSLYAFALVSRKQTVTRELFYFKAHEAKLIRITTLSFAIMVAIAGTMEALYQCYWSDTRAIVEKLRLNRINAPGGAMPVQVKNQRLAASLSSGNHQGFANSLNSDYFQQALWNATNEIRIDGRPENYVRRAKIYDAMGLTQRAKQDLIMAESIDNDGDRYLLTAR